MAETTKKVMSSYMRALRATRVAFKGKIISVFSFFFFSKENIETVFNTIRTEDTNKYIGDTTVFNASRQKIREQFRNPDLSKELEARLKEMDEISTFLMRNIVQAKKAEENKYLLNIHKHTELGDNESVKKTKQLLVERGGGCCGGSNAKI